MKKSFKIYAITWTLAIITFNIISFITPTDKIGSFWVGYTFITSMFIIQLVCSYLFLKQDTKNKVFLVVILFILVVHIPIITISYIALLVSIIFGTVFMVVTKFPIWIAIIISLLVTVFYLIAIISMKPAINAIENIDKKVKMQTFFIKSLTIDAQTLTLKSKSNEIKQLSEKVYEAIRYSDPMNNEALTSCESAITLKFKEFEKSVIDDNLELAEDISKKLIILINDRNQKCKLLK